MAFSADREISFAPQDGRLGAGNAPQPPLGQAIGHGIGMAGLRNPEPALEIERRSWRERKRILEKRCPRAAPEGECCGSAGRAPVDITPTASAASIPVLGGPRRIVFDPGTR